jgi:glycosyltransferase involved in cell wall biosynthesis
VQIDYITMYDLPDRARWPRTQLGMCQAAAAIASGLSDLGCGANFIGGLTSPRWAKPLTRLKWSFYRHFTDRDYYRWAEPAIVQSYGRQVSHRLRSSSGDIALCVENALPIAAINSTARTAQTNQNTNPKPIVLWTDAPLAALIGLYPYMSNLCNETRRNIYRWEAMAFDRCELIVFSSDWAADIARRHYPRSAHKIAVIPWGANLDRVPDRSTVHTAIEHRSHTTLELVFLGQEWERKGGVLALEIVAALRDRHLPVRLTVIGSTPTIPTDLAPHVRLCGYLNKHNTTDRDRLQQALLQSHFLLLPTRAETYGMVFCEAAAFGLPAIATQMGGIPTIIRDGVSGYTFGLEATAEEYATTIATLWHDRDRYCSLAHQARHEFETRLNWAIACEQMRDRLAQCL